MTKKLFIDSTGGSLKAPVVSYVIPCWNAEKFIGQAIESVLGQTYENIELVVVDDGSTDGSRRVIESFKERVKYVSVSNGGASRARNIGLNMCIGEYVKFLDADDVIQRDATECEINLLREFESSDVLVMGGANYVDEDLSVQGVCWPQGSSVRLNRGAKVDLEWSLFNTPPVGSPLYRRDLLVGIGGFNEILTNKEDNDLFIRYIVCGALAVYSGSNCYLYRQYDDTKRITPDALGRNAPSQVLFLKSHMELSESISSNEVRGILIRATAMRAWSWGRDLVRAKKIDAANEHFVIAKKLLGKNYSFGSRFYRVLTSTLGPVHAERLIEMVKKVVLHELKLRWWGTAKGI